MRESLGLTVVEMAKIHGVTAFWIVQMEKGHQRISEIYFQRLLKLYEAKKRGVPVHQKG